jgi:PIN domain nuclease of toxin-antitoxin system
MDGRTMLLDTHAVVFLHAGRLEEFSELGKRLLEQEQVYLGPMAALELQYLYEIERIRYPAQRIMDDLYLEIGLRILERDWMSVIRKSWDLDWTRDPFDRLIAAQALIEGQRLLTRDGQLLAECPVACW